MEGFMFENAEQACKFYERCMAEEITTQQGRIALIRQMVKEKRAMYVAHPETFLEGRNVIDLTKKEPPLE